MSRIAKQPVELPKGVEFQQSGTVVTVKGGKGSLSMELNTEVQIAQDEGMLSFTPRSGSKFAIAMSGTTRALLANMVTGVSDGFERSWNWSVLVIALRRQAISLISPWDFRIRLCMTCRKVSALKRRARRKL